MSTKLWLSCGLTMDNQREDVLILTSIVLSEKQGLSAVFRELRGEYNLSIRKSIDLSIEACRLLAEQGNLNAREAVAEWCKATTHPMPDWAKGSTWAKGIEALSE